MSNADLLTIAPVTQAANVEVVSMGTFDLECEYEPRKRRAKNNLK